MITKSHAYPRAGLADLAADVRAYGYYGGIRLIKATLKRFHDYCVETGADLHDRVAQAYQGIVYMDFNRAHMEEHGYGIYAPLEYTHLPNIYVAFNTTLAEGTEVVHNTLRYRWDNGDPAVHDAMAGFAELTDRFRAALEAGDPTQLDTIINANFDLRRSIMNLNPQHIAMVETARSLGASAKFTGSGGAIIGTYADDAMFARLKDALRAAGMTVIRPEIV